jgi:hypothetical protein
MCEREKGGSLPKTPMKSLFAADARANDYEIIFSKNKIY